MGKGQLSAEMLILLVLILALVAIVYTQMTKTVNSAAAGVDVKTWDMLHAGNACNLESDCTNNTAGSQLTCTNSKCAYR
ncbi:MAG: hypothetical protein M1530_04000 [Candidatus Marsarchaeota archaeon]|nr:hypothetical protein [Candidatus Marsarchaeota archaeon]